MWTHWQRLDRDGAWMRLGVLLLGLWLMVTLVLPLGTLLIKSFKTPKGLGLGWTITPATLRPPR